MSEIKTTITPRDVRFHLSEPPNRYWWDDDLIKTAILDSFAIALPDGERFFIRSLQHYAKTIDDEMLTEEIKNFSLQEAFHTREHMEYNRVLSLLGYDVQIMTNNIIGGLWKIKSPLHRLAITCAIEHLTTSMSNMILTRPEILNGADKRYFKLWIWHALEELEHTSVAMDVYNLVTRREELSSSKAYGLRITIYLLILLEMMRGVFKNIALYAKTDGVKTGVKFWGKCFFVAFFKPGNVRLMIKYALRYYRPGYQPAKHVNHELIAKWDQWVDQEIVQKQ